MSVETSLDVMQAQTTNQPRNQPRITGTGGGGSLSPVRDSESARALINKRWGAHRAAIAAGVKLGTKRETLRAAVMEIAATQAEIAVSTRPGSTAAATFVYKSLGIFERDATHGENSVRITLVGSVANRLLSHLLDTPPNDDTPPVTVTSDAHELHDTDHTPHSPALSATPHDTITPPVSVTPAPTTLPDTPTKPRRTTRKTRPHTPPRPTTSERVE